MRNTIVRTFNTTTAHCTVYIDGTISDSLITVPSDTITTEKAEKYIRKTNSCVGKLVSVDSLSKSSAIYGMEESDFIRLATRVPERGKATRNAITKTVCYFEADYIYMDTNTRAVSMRPVTVPLSAKEKLDKYGKSIEQENEKYISIENLHEVNALYAMSEGNFMRNARRMKDYQHYE